MSSTLPHQPTIRIAAHIVAHLTEVLLQDTCLTQQAQRNADTWFSLCQVQLEG